MLLQYGPLNGTPVSLNLLELKEYRQEDVYDGPAYVCTEVTLVLRAVYNPATQGDSWGSSPRYAADNTLPVNIYAPPLSIGAGIPNFSPPGGPEQDSLVPGAVSNSALRHFLLQPRQQLVFSVGGIPTIVSPMPPAPADVMNGPIPLACNVTEIQGTRTWMVDYAIKTYINECPLYGSPYPLVISHVWTMRHELDQDYFTSQVIEGRFTLRADSLGLLGFPADFFRSQLLPLPAPGFKREAVEVWYPFDYPNVLNYKIRDRQLPIGYGAVGVTRIQATHEVSSDSMPIEHQLAAAGAGMLGEGLLLGLEHAVSSGWWSKVKSLGLGAAGFVATLPQTRHLVVVDVWGDGTSKRSDLEFFGMQIVGTRLVALFNVLKNSPILAQALGNLLPETSAAINAALNQINPEIPKINITLQWLSAMAYGHHKLIRHDLTGKHVHIEWGLTSGPLISLVNQFATGVWNASANKVFPLIDDTPPILIVNGNPVNGFNGANSIFQWPPQGDGSSRSDWIGLCLGAALQGPCQLPEVPFPTLPQVQFIQPGGSKDLILPSPKLGINTSGTALAGDGPTLAPDNTATV